MSRKDYIEIAGFLRDLKPIPAGYQLERWNEMVAYFIKRFATANGRFDAEKFREAIKG